VATFYLDEDISHAVVPFLQAAGHRAITTREIQREHSSDDDPVFHAWRNRWILVTHNGRDFALVHRTLHRWAATWEIRDIHAGILVIPHGSGPRAAAGFLDVFAASALPTANTLYAWQPIGEWVRR
jgi:hypothetical protein